MPRRDRFVSEVGPEARGSKPVMDVWTHAPDKFGTGAAPLVLLPVGVAACPKPGAVNTASIARKRSSCCRIFMLSRHGRAGIFGEILYPLRGRAKETPIQRLKDRR